MSTFYQELTKLVGRLHTASIGKPCERCGKPIEPGQPVSFEYEGPSKPARASHSACFRVTVMPFGINL